MTNEQENKEGSQKWAADRLLTFIKVCPHIIEHGIGIETFVDDLNKAATKLNEDFKDTAGPMIELLPLVTACPNIFKPGIGVEAFVKDLCMATTKYNLYFQVKRSG